MIGVFNNISIEGIAAAVPSMIEENIAASAFLGERRCKKQIKLTGIKERHVSPQGQKISDLYYLAAHELISHLQWEKDEIKVLVLLTQSPDFEIPSTAFYMQKLLGLPQDSIVFDVNIGCTAFNIGINIVGSLLQQFPVGTKAICMQGDVISEVIKEGVSEDYMANMLLFGSAGSVFAMEKKRNCGRLYYATYSNGYEYAKLIRNHGQQTKMDGNAVFNFSANYVTQKIDEFKCDVSIEEKNIDYYVWHQAQKLILDVFQTNIGYVSKKELRSLEKYGNTAGASVPLTICANKEVFVNREFLRLFTCGFGIGLSVSMAYFEVKVKNILPIYIL